MGRAGLIAALVLAIVVPALADDGANGAPPARYRVGGVEIGGLPDEPEVSDAILMSVPLYYDAGAVRRVIESLSRLLSDGGYPYNRISTEVIKDGDVQRAADSSESAIGASISDTSITIYFTVDHGERVCAGRPLIIGSRGPKKFFYYDIGFVPGKFYSGSVVDEAVRRLSFRPYVERASATPPVIIEDAPLCRDSLREAVVAITVTERSAVEVEGALGYESGRGGSSGQLRGQLGLSFVNKLGHGEQADVSYIGVRGAQRVKLAGAFPWVFDLPVGLGASFAAEVEDGGYGFFGGEVLGSVEVGARYRAGAALSATETIPPDSVGDPYKYYGAEFFFELNRRPFERGAFVPEFSARAGSGAAYRERSYLRGRAEAALGAHYPVYGAFALLGRVCAKSLFTDEGYLSPAELYRMGGHGSLRGYSEEEFAFRSVAYTQAEFLYYFSGESSVYAFVDGGAGFDTPGPLTMASAKKLLGYGLGIRFPSRLGAVELEWARNAGDEWSLGRVHVGVRAGME